MAMLLRLTAKKDVSSPLKSYGPDKGKDLKKGYSFIAPDAISSKDVPRNWNVKWEYFVGALIKEGFSTEEAEYYYNGSPVNNFDLQYAGEMDFEFQSEIWQIWLKKDEFSAKNNSIKNENKQVLEQNTHRSCDGSNERSCCGGFFHFLCQVLFTIIPILPVWWIIKLFMNAGWYCIKAIGYVISWPVRLLCCCFCSTQLLPDATSMPEYWFNMK